MIRSITQDDAAAVVDLAVASGLFEEADAGIVRKMMTDYFGGGEGEGHACIVDADDEPMGVAYYEPALATDGTWYLTMIGVRRGDQGQGRGAALLRHVEERLRADDQRLLLVETSGLPAFDRTRAFYRKCGYEQEARVRDYYEPGDDMVLFRKSLGPVTPVG